MIVHMDVLTIWLAEVKVEMSVHLIDRSKNRNIFQKINQRIEPLVDVELVVFDTFVLVVVHPLV